MNFRKSTFDDIDRILKIIEKAKAELKKMGLDQWQKGYPNREVIESDVKKGISYVLEDRALPSGMPRRPARTSTRRSLRATRRAATTCRCRPT